MGIYIGMVVGTSLMTNRHSKSFILFFDPYKELAEELGKTS